MTCCPVVLTCGDTEVWSIEWVNGTEAPFPTWTFYSMPRTPVGEEAQP
jgi:hypothetical protein